MAASAPMVGDPLCRQYPAVPLATHAGDGVGRVGLAVERDDACAFGNGGRGEPAHEATAQAVALEAAAPLVGPVVELALACQVAGDELLLVAHIGNGGGVVVLQMLQRIGVGADGVDVAGGVARAIALVPFLYHG